jgi:hypothetical protein
MFKVSVTLGDKTVTASTGTLFSDGAKKLMGQLKTLGVEIKDAAGKAITPTVSQLQDLAKAARDYCGETVKGTANQIKTVVDDAVKYCKEMGIKGKSTFEQVATYLKANGPTITVTDAPIVDSPSDIGG